MKGQKRTFLLLGILGGILTMTGDCLLLGADSTGAAGILGRYAMIAQRISYLRTGLAGFFGFVGIPLTVFGFYFLYLQLYDKKCIAARLYRLSLGGYVAFGGAVHVICCYLVTGMKKDLEAGTEDLVGTLLYEQGGYVIPCMLVFLVVYLLQVSTMILLIAGRRTPLPAWMWVLNPLTFKLVINLIGRQGSSALSNALLCSNMSLGAICIFLVWLLLPGREALPGEGQTPDQGDAGQGTALERGERGKQGSSHSKEIGI